MDKSIVNIKTHTFTELDRTFFVSQPVSQIRAKTGKHCDQLITTTTTTMRPIVTAAPSPCASSPCLNSGTCILQADINNPYRCACTQYTYGTRCENVNRCFTGASPCLNNGICIPGANGAYTCACTPQYTGSTCETLIQPISICASQPCTNGGTCLSLNDNAAYFCNCPPGYSGSRCGVLLEDNRIRVIFKCSSFYLFIYVNSRIGQSMYKCTMLQ
ncbi:unnamed protein product [Rotaria magnacalcarata]|uniref:EGF-like domain-containing protein n=1 Tax=Rotaria magnacalcarata TaxID=392030 RepID=A0A8S2SPW1_9BILA|nr:unnamed protein product [Rotaria magnacalcarata]CAF5183334.1 unnamed protein product [Rotaria magnacalcarata]